MEQEQLQLPNNKKVTNVLSIVIPVHNEEKSIKKTIEEIRKVLNENNINKTTEIIVVNDGSSDKTKDIVLSLDVKVIDNATKRGYGYSLKKGILAAKNDIVVIIDGDLTYPFNYLNEMLSKKKEGYDMVIGARNGQYYKGNYIKYACRLIIKKIAEFVCGKKIKDINSGFRVFNKTTVIKYFSKMCDTFSFTTTQTLNYLMDNLKIGYVDIPYNKRIGKSKVRIFKDGFIMLKYIILCGLYYKPLKTIIGIICVLIILMLPLLLVF